MYAKMATAQTMSPSTEASCVLQPSNSEPMVKSEEASFQKPMIDHNMPSGGHVSAPDAETEISAQQLQQNGKQIKVKRRKRRNSFNENSNAGGNQNGKRRRGNANYKRHMSACGRIILPTRFLLGGNINDPLNLNSMMDENINRALNAVTPSSSPLPPRSSVIDIVTPEDVTDPLGLNSSGFTPPTVAETQKSKGKRKRRRKSQAVKHQEQKNPEASSNSDDLKGGTTIDQNPLIASSNNVTTPADPTGKRIVAQNKKKKHSPSKNVGHLSFPASQVNIRDPIVSPAVPQDTRRFKSTFGSKNKRRRHGTGKPMTSDAGIQTDCQGELEENLRCGSEKIRDRQFFSPVKRRRTVSENLSLPLFWDNERLERVNTSLGNVTAKDYGTSSKSFSQDISSFLPHPIGAKQFEEQGKSPAQNYMNKELKPETKETTSSSRDVKRRRPSEVQQHKSQISEDSRPKQSKDCRSYSSGRKGSSKKPYNAKFQYGNYNKYYGYRNTEKFKDIRMDCLKKEWFKEKDVLDIGCNAGHLTLLIARDYEPRKIVGIDIDDSLIRVARNNIRHYASTSKSVPKFPASMAISHGPLTCPPVETGKDETTAAFPNNINFFQGNYVPQKDEFLHFQEPEYDVIMCMSVSKWVHLNWGDAGLVRMFKRVFKQLRAGGMFILEPQQWSSYSSKRKICEKLNENYRSIKIRPDSFPELLLREIGFQRVDHLNLQKRNKAAGFQRPIQVYYKPE